MDGALEITVPNLGEGVRYVTVKSILRSNGEFVREDEGVIEVETDKAVVEIPSPTDGCVCNITCKPGDILPVGSNLLIIRKNLKGEGETTFLASNQKRKKDSVPSKNINIESGNSKREETLSACQQALVGSMKKSSAIVVPATVERDISWDFIDLIKKHFRKNEKNVVPRSMEIICWAISKSIERFDKFKIKIDFDDTIIFSEKTILGIAVADNNDDLLNHVVSVYQCSDVISFVNTFRSSLVRREKGYHSVSISDMSSLGAHRATPVVVHPSVATIFIGSPFDIFTKNGWGRKASLSVTFDHRVMNGAYVAAFLVDIEDNIKAYAKLLGV